MLNSRFIRALFTLLVLAALTTSCININMPGTGSKTLPGSGETAPPAGTGATVTEPPTIESFAASPENLSEGRSGTLSWSVKNADTIIITPDIGKVDASGSKTVKPANQTTYTLVASNSAGMAAKPVTIKIYTYRTIDPGLQEIEKPGSGTQTTPSDSDGYIIGKLGTDLVFLENKPDIVVSDFKVYCVPAINGTFCNLDYYVKNIGSTNSSPMVVILKVDDVFKSADNVSSLASGVTIQRAFSYKFKPDAKALHRIDIVADFDNNNSEQNENNNTLTANIPYR